MMSNKTPLKTLPLFAVLAISLVLSPTLLMAANGDRGHHKEKYSQDAGKHHNKGKYRGNKHSVKTHGKSHKDNHRSKHHYSTGHGHHNKHAYYKQGHHNHGYGHHDHSSHSSINYIVNDHYYSDAHPGLAQLRFMIGLHSDNLDITFRD